MDALSYVVKCIDEGIEFDRRHIPPEIDADTAQRYHDAISATQVTAPPFSVGNFQTSESNGFYDPQYLDALDSKVMRNAIHSGPKISFTERLKTKIAQWKAAFNTPPKPNTMPLPDKPKKPKTKLFPKQPKPQVVPTPKPQVTVSASADAATRLKIQSQLQQGQANDKSRKV